MGLIDVGVQRGYKIPDKNTNTEFLDKGIFTFHYNGSVIMFERQNLNNFSGKNKDKKHWFTLLNNNKYYISEETYYKARDYFVNSNYDKLKIELKKNLLNKKIKKLKD